MFTQFLKICQIAILSAALNNTSMMALAQDVQVAGISEIHEAFVKKLMAERNSAAELLAEFNVQRAKEGLPSVTSYSDALRKAKTPAETEKVQAIYNESKRRVENGLTAAVDAAILNDYNDTRKAQGKESVASYDEATKNKSPAELQKVFADYQKSLIKVRSKLGLAVPPAPPEFPAIGVAGISEIHEGVASNNSQAAAQNGPPQSSSGGTKLDAADDSSMTGSITMIAIGFIASRMYKYKFTTDIMIAMAGGGAFIVGEILSTNKFKETAKEMEIANSVSNKDEKQISSLTSLKKTYEEAKEAAETKKNFQTAAAVAFAAAAGTAFFVKGLEITAETATVTGLTTAAGTATATATAAAAGCAVGATCAIVATCTKAAATFSADVAARKAANLKRDFAMGPSATLYPADLADRTLFFTQVTTTAATCPPTTPVTAIVKAEDTVQWAGNSFTASPHVGVLKPQPTINPNYFERLLNLAFPSAEASMMNLLMGGAGAGAGILLGMVTTMGTMVDTYMFAPKNRAIVWGMLAGLSYVASSGTEETIGKLEQNISKIDSVITGVNQAGGQGVAITNGVKDPKGNGTKDLTMKAVNPNLNTYAAISKDPTQKTSCLTSAGESNCTSLESQAQGMGLIQQLPSSLRGYATDSLRMGDGISGTNRISGATQGIAQSLGSQSRAINKLLAKQKENFNKRLEKNGKGAINFAAAEKGLLKNFNAAVVKSLKQNKTSPSGFLASFGSSLSSGALGDAAKKGEDANAVAEKSSGINPGSSGASIDGNSTAFEFKEKSLDENLGEDGAAANADALAKLDADKNGLESFELGKNDISTNPETSLFELISNRYQKSGYPRLFKTIPAEKK